MTLLLLRQKLSIDQVSFGRSVVQAAQAQLAVSYEVLNANQHQLWGKVRLNL